MNEDKIIIDYDDLYLLDNGIYEWEEHAFTGIAREFRDDGSVVNEIEYVNGFQEGIARNYYSSGRLYSKKHWFKNNLHGEAREWYENGQVKQDALFEYGIPIRDNRWDENGNQVKVFQLTKEHPLYKTLQTYRKIYSKI